MGCGVAEEKLWMSALLRNLNESCFWMKVALVRMAWTSTSTTTEVTTTEVVVVVVVVAVVV